MSLRTPETKEKYREALFSSKDFDFGKLEAIDQYKYWRLVDNQFPYDAAFSTHHLLVPIRIVDERGDLTVNEATELTAILRYVGGNYDCMMENFPRYRSVGKHFHVHLLTYKKSRDDNE